MAFKYGRASKRNIATGVPVLQQLLNRFIEITDVDASVVEVIRSLEQQQKNIDDGVSWTLDSYHLTGEAADIYPWVNGTSSQAPSAYRRIAKAMFQAAQEIDMEGYRLEWGGFWHKLDSPHWQLVRIHQ